MSILENFQNFTSFKSLKLKEPERKNRTNAKLVGRLPVVSDNVRTPVHNANCNLSNGWRSGLEKIEPGEMEDTCSVNSPRRTLSFSKNRRATVSFPDPDDKVLGIDVSGDHGPKSPEVYRFAGSISTVATVIFMVWVYVPEQWLHSIGISYFPIKYWALAVPAYAMVTIVLAVWFYSGLNFMVTPPPTSFNTLFDECSREPLSSIHSTNEDEQLIEPISDIGIDHINQLMFCDHS